MQCKIFAPQPNKSRAKPTILPTFKSERYGDLDICSGKERAQLPNCLGGGSPPPASYFSPLSLSPQFELFATWFLSIQLFWGFFATARQVTLAEGVSGRRRHEKERPRRLTLQSTPSAMPQNPFAQFSSVSHLPFQVFYPCIL